MTGVDPASTTSRHEGRRHRLLNPVEITGVCGAALLRKTGHGSRNAAVALIRLLSEKGEAWLDDHLAEGNEFLIVSGDFVCPEPIRREVALDPETLAMASQASDACNIISTFLDVGSIYRRVKADLAARQAANQQFRFGRG